jgi:hypothetical protein
MSKPGANCEASAALSQPVTAGAIALAPAIGSIEACTVVNER